MYHILKKYGITPQQYHSGYLVGSHCHILMGKSVEILEEMKNLLKSVPMGNRRKRNITSEQVATRDDLEQRCLVGLLDLLTLADAVYLYCNSPAGTLSDDDLDKAQRTVKTFSRLWRQNEMVSVMRKTYNMEKHFMYFL